MQFRRRIMMMIRKLAKWKRLWIIKIFKRITGYAIAIVHTIITRCCWLIIFLWNESINARNQLWLDQLIVIELRMESSKKKQKSVQLQRLRFFNTEKRNLFCLHFDLMFIVYIFYIFEPSLDSWVFR